MDQLQQPKRLSDVLSLEHDERLNRQESDRSNRPACDHKITHASTAITQVTTSQNRMENSRPSPMGGRLREGERRTDIEPEPITLLPDELKVNTSIPVQESCNIGRF